MYLLGGTHVLDLTPETIYMPPPAGEAVHIPYTDPAHPGALPGPPWRRYYIGSVHLGPWPVDSNLNYSWNPLGYPTLEGLLDAVSRVVSVADPTNAYIEIGQREDWGYPDFRIGDSIYDDNANTWTIVVPHDATAREAYLYPRPPSASDKIYYADSQSINSPYPPLPLLVGDLVYTDYAENGYCIITELGSDAVGTWFKCRAATELWGPSELIVWTAGEVGTTDTGSPKRNFNVMPWKSVTGGPFGG